MNSLIFAWLERARTARRSHSSLCGDLREISIAMAKEFRCFQGLSVKGTSVLLDGGDRTVCTPHNAAMVAPYA